MYLYLAGSAEWTDLGNPPFASNARTFLKSDNGSNLAFINVVRYSRAFGYVSTRKVPQWSMFTSRGTVFDYYTSSLWVTVVGEPPQELDTAVVISVVSCPGVDVGDPNYLFHPLFRVAYFKSTGAVCVTGADETYLYLFSDVMADIHEFPVSIHSQFKFIDYTTVVP